MTTNHVRAEITEILDIGTRPNRQGIYKLHTPVGYMTRQILAGFFLQYKQYKYSGCDFQLVPAAQLPADPSQLTLGAGEQPLDPRDLVNPIVYKGYRGERLQAAAGGFTDDNVNLNADNDALELRSLEGAEAINLANYTSWYYSALTDPSFKKAGIQRGFRTSCYPLVRKVQANKDLGVQGWGQDGAMVADLGNTVNGNAAVATPMPVNSPGRATGVLGTPSVTTPSSVNMGIFTSGSERLGWMDISKEALPSAAVGANNASINAGPDGGNTLYGSRMPKVWMMLMMLPPAYKQEMYFRVAIKHHFEFARVRSAYSHSIDSAAMQLSTGVVEPTTSLTSSGDVVEIPSDNADYSFVIKTNRKVDTLVCEDTAEGMVRPVSIGLG